MYVMHRQKDKEFSQVHTNACLKNKGFTLVELIIVVAIIAVLAAVLAPQYLQYVERAKETNDLQVATNIMRAATVAIADPKSNVPSGHYVEVLWGTGDKRTGSSDLYSGLLYVRPPQTRYRMSTISQDGELAPLQNFGGTTGVDMDHLLDMILSIMGSDERNTGVSGAGVTGNIGDAESRAGNESSLCFHISTTDGTIALAKYIGGADGDVNVWIDKLGIDAIPAP